LVTGACTTGAELAGAGVLTPLSLVYTLVVGVAGEAAVALDDPAAVLAAADLRAASRARNVTAWACAMRDRPRVRSSSGGGPVRLAGTTAPPALEPRITCGTPSADGDVEAVTPPIAMNAASTAAAAAARITQSAISVTRARLIVDWARAETAFIAVDRECDA
jgi:hypothetical protein